MDLGMMWYANKCENEQMLDEVAEFLEVGYDLRTACIKADVDPDSLTAADLKYLGY